MQENLNTAQLEQTGENTAGPAAGGENEAERRERYDRLIKEEFKDLYTGDTQKLINRRFKELHELREKFRLQEQELEALRRQAAPPAPDYSGQIEEMKAERPDFDFEKEMERPPPGRSATMRSLLRRPQVRQGWRQNEKSRRTSPAGAAVPEKTPLPAAV